jgi:uncharacterized membrane protein
MLKLATTSGFLGVDWSSIALVFVVALVAVVIVVSVYSLGLRLLATGPDVQHRRPLATVGALACIAVGIAAVLYGVYLVIPAFHQ